MIPFPQNPLRKLLAILLTMLAALGAASARTPVSPGVLTKLVPDHTRPVVYGLNEINAASGRVLVIDTDTEQIARALRIAGNVSDMAIDLRAANLYVIHFPNNLITKIDLRTLSVVGTRNIPAPDPPNDPNGDHYDIAAGRPDLVYYNTASERPRLHAFNFATGQIVGSATPDDGIGDFAIDEDGNTLYSTGHRFWSVVERGVNVSKYDISTNAIQFLDKIDTFNDDAVPGPPTLVSSGNLLFSRHRAFPKVPFNDDVIRFPEEIYGITRSGNLAISERTIYETSTELALETLPFVSRVMAVEKDQNKLFIARNSPSEFTTVSLEALTSVNQTKPNPAQDEIVAGALRELSWDPVPGASSYRVYLGSDLASVQAATPGSPLEVGEFSESSAPITQPAPGETHYWRLDVISPAGTQAGPVWNFTLMPFIATPAAFDINSVTGTPTIPLEINLAVPGSSADWQATESIPWLTLDQTSGTAPGKITGAIIPGALTPGVRTGEIRLVSGGITYDLPVRFSLTRLALTQMITDVHRPFIYGLHPGDPGGPNGLVVVIGTESEEIEQTLSVGTNPNDFSITAEGDRLYVSNPDTMTIQVVNLDPLGVLSPLPIPTTPRTVNAGAAGRLFYTEEDGFNASGTLYEVDPRTGASTQIFRPYQGEGEFSPDGAFYYNAPGRDDTIPGFTGRPIEKFDARGQNFTRVAESREQRGVRRRFVISADGSRLFWARHVFDADLNQLQALPDEIYASTADGELAFTSTQVVRTRSGQPEADLPFATTVLAPSADSEKLFLYNPGDNRVDVLSLSDLVDLPGPSPHDRETIDLSLVSPLTWTAHPAADSYRVFLSSDRGLVVGGDPQALVGSPATNSLPFTQTLQPGETYYWRVDAVVAGQTEVEGKIWSFHVAYPLVTYAQGTRSGSGGGGLGASVALTDRVCVAGIPHGLGVGFGGHRNGWIQIFERAPGSDLWETGAPIPNPESFREDFFGASVAVNSKYVAVGAPGPNGDDRTGKVSIFEKKDDRWTLLTVLEPPRPTFNRFGAAIAMDERHLAVGCPQSPVRNSDDAGVVFLYQVGTWKAAGNLPHPEPADDRWFGRTLSLHGDVLAAGELPSGAVFTFERDPDTEQWSFRQKITRPAGADLSFGARLTVSERHLAISHLPDAGPTGVFVYERNVAGDWVQPTELRSGRSSPDSEDNLGFSHAFNDGRLFIGGPGRNDGHVFSYRGTPLGPRTSWNPLATIRTNLDTGGFRRGLGSTLATAGDYLVAGLPYIEQSPATSSAGGLLFHRIGIEGNHPPVITSAPFAQGTEEVPYRYTVTGTDEDTGNTLGLHLVKGPGWLQIEPAGDTAFALTGTPPDGSRGVHNIILELRDDAGGATSQIFDLEILKGSPPATIISLSPDLAAFLHAGHILSVEADSESDIAYQWYRDGELIPGATSAELHLDPLTARDAGDYHVTLQNAGGTITSDPITVTVEPNDRIGGNWSTFGKDSSRTGFYPATLRRHRFLPVWSNDYIDSFAANQPATGLGMVFATANDDSAPATVALDLKSGREIWRTLFEDPDSMNPPTYYRGRVYFQRGNHSSDSQLWSLDARTGQVIWSSPYSAQWDRYFAPAVNERGIYVASGSSGGMSHYGHDGVRVFGRGFEHFDKWAPSLSPDGRLFAWVAGQFHEMDPADGTTLWSIDTGWRNSSREMNSVAAISRNKAVVAGGGWIECYDLDRQIARWRVSGGVHGSPTIAGNEVYFIRGNRILTLSLEDGRTLGQFQTSDGTEFRDGAQPIVLEDVVIATARDGTFIFDRSTRELIQSIRLGGLAAFTDGYLLISSPGTIHAYYANRHPEFAGEIVPSVIEDSEYRTTLAISDEDGDALSVTPIGLPSFLQLSHDRNTVTLAGTPRSEDLGTHTFSLRVIDANNLPTTREFSLEVTALVDLVLMASTNRDLVGAPGSADHTITLQNLGPSNATAITVDLAAVVPAGVSTTEIVPSHGTVTGDQWTLSLAEAESASLRFRHEVADTARGGIDVLSTSASVRSVDQPLANEDDHAAATSSSIVSPADTGVLELDASPGLNLQDGLFTQRVTLTNNNPLPLAGFQLVVGGLPADVQAYNANGSSAGGAPSITSNNDLDPGASVTLTVEFYRASLDATFNPAFTVSGVYSDDPTSPAPAAGGADLERILSLDNGDVLLEFSSTPGSRYAIEYSHDMQTWHRVEPALTANANRTQWIDSGPPKTVSHPALVPNRYYRLVTLSPASN